MTQVVESQLSKHSDILSLIN